MTSPVKLGDVRLLTESIVTTPNFSFIHQVFLECGNLKVTILTTIFSTLIPAILDNFGYLGLVSCCNALSDEYIHKPACTGRKLEFRVEFPGISLGMSLFQNLMQEMSNFQHILWCRVV